MKDSRSVGLVLIRGSVGLSLFQGFCLPSKLHGNFRKEIGTAPGSPRVHYFTWLSAHKACDFDGSVRN